MSEIGRREIAREDALLWLHDRLGQELQLDTRVDCGGQTISVVSAVGELHHSSDDDKPPQAGAVGDALRRTFIGLYSVGGADFDIGDEDSVLRWRFGLRAAQGKLTAPGDELVLSAHGCVELVIGPPPKLAKVDDVQ